MSLFTFGNSPIKVRKINSASQYDIPSLTKNDNQALDILIKVLNRQILRYHMKILKDLKKNGMASFTNNKEHKIKASIEILSYFWAVSNIYMSKHNVPKALGNALYICIAESIAPYSNYIPIHFSDIDDVLNSRTETYFEYFKRIREGDNFKSVMDDFNTMMVVDPLCEIDPTQFNVQSIMRHGIMGSTVFTTWSTGLMLEEEKAINELFSNIYSN